MNFGYIYCWMNLIHFEISSLVLKQMKFVSEIWRKYCFQNKNKLPHMETKCFYIKRCTVYLYREVTKVQIDVCIHKNAIKYYIIFFLSITCSHIWNIDATKYVNWLDTHSVKVWWNYMLQNFHLFYR